MDPSGSDKRTAARQSRARDAPVRWQKIAIDQLGYALNLVLTFTVAALGYAFALLRDDGFRPVPCAKCLFIIALAGLATSAVCGLACVLTRLSDFRGTAERARADGTAPTKGRLKRLGEWTWYLFRFQLVAFALGVAALGVALLLTFGGKLR